MDEDGSTNIEDMQTEMSTKKVRHRKKKLYQAILQQMEFYFGDANLTKDRFLGRLIQENEYVDLSIFLSFNKIRCHTSDIEDIAKALRNSEMLSVSEDGTKVCRVTPIKEKENEDDCTIYVEQLPPDADHDWLKGVFSAYGKVSYVSIPKYKASKKIKGFAFIEFDTPEDASRTVEAFSAMGCCLPVEMPPEQLCSISTFSNEGGNENRSNGHVKEECVDEPHTGEIGEGKRSKKRRKQNKEESEGNESGEAIHEHTENTDDPPVKKKKKTECLEEESLESTNVENIDVPSSKKKKKKDHSAQIKEEGEAHSEQLDKVPEKHKKRKEKKSGEESKDNDHSETDTDQVETPPKKKKRKHNEETESENSPAVPEKRKRTEEPVDDGVAAADNEGCSEDLTLNAEEGGGIEEEVQEDDDSIHKKKKNRKRKKKSRKEKVETDGNRLGLQILRKRDWKKLRNKYLELQRSKMKSFKQHLARSYWESKYQDEGWRNNQDWPQECMEETAMENKPPPSTPRVTYTPGVIIHIQLEEPVVDVKKFKSDTKSYPEVQYIDINEGDSEAYLRCSTAEAAQHLVSEKPWNQISILEGEVENTYWEKIKRDREQKIGKKVRVKQRGRDKLLKKADSELSKHMRFDD